MFTIICEICGKKKESTHRHTKICSRTCALQRARNRYGREYQKYLAYGTVGAIGELRICSDLLEKGYSVFRSVSPSCYCDLIAVKDSRKLEIEVRTGYLNKINGILNFSKKKHGAINCFAVAERNTSSIFYFDEEGNSINLD